MDFMKRHREYTAGALTGEVPLSKLAAFARERAADEDSTAAKKDIGEQEVKAFKPSARAVVDRHLPAPKKGYPASIIKENGELVKFVSVASLDIRLRARAGSGKSTALVIKCDMLINELGVPPEAIQLLTFNRAAAEDLRAKLRKAFGDDVGGRIGTNTFHSLAWHVLHQHPETSQLTMKFGEDDEDGRDSGNDAGLLMRAVRQEMTTTMIEFYRNRFKGGVDYRFLADKPDFEASLERFLASAAALYRARGGKRDKGANPAIGKDIKRIVDAYEAMLIKNGTMDGEMGIRRAGEILQSDAALPRFKRLNGNLQILMVDEYQDFSISFENLVSGIMSRNPNCVLNVVGDDWQSINSYMGADLDFFRGFRGRRPAAINMSLQTNWRCGKRIVELGNKVMTGTKKEEAMAGVAYDGRIRVAEGNIASDFRPAAEWKEYAQAFLRANIVDMAQKAWAQDLREGREELGSLALLASKNELFGCDLSSYARDLDAISEGAKVEVSTSHASKGREWDHVILLDGIEMHYPSAHPGNLVAKGVLAESTFKQEGHRLLYVAVTRAKRSLGILAPTKIHPRLEQAREISGR